MKYYIKKILNLIPFFLTITALIPLYGCGSGLDGLLDQPVVIPVSPANVQATDGIYPDKVEITWNSSSGATSYNIYRSADGISYALIAGEVTGLTYNDTSVTLSNPPTYYQYKVTAVNSAGNSGIDSTGTEPDQGYADPTIFMENAPSNVTATDGTIAGTITISWNSLTNATHYRLYKSSSSGGTYTLEQDNITAATYNFSSTAGTTWWFKVSAVDAYSESGMSLPDDGHAMGVPAAIDSANITASDTSSRFIDHILVQWSAATGEGTIAGYNIYGSDTSDGEYTKLNTSLITDLYYDESVEEEGKTRFYKISAVNEAGEGELSSYEAGQTWGTQPAAATGVSATPGSSTAEITITWSASADADGYRVYRADTADGTYVQIGNDLDAVVLTYSDTAGTPGVHYFYRVAAYKEFGGESVWSDPTEGWILAPPEQITGVSATDGTLVGQIIITWNTPSGTVTSYRIYRYTDPDCTLNETIFTPSVLSTNYTDTTSGTGDFYYKVSAVNSAGEGTLSDYDRGNIMVIPSAPANVSASDGVSENSIIISWDAPPEFVTSYIIYRCDTVDGTYSQIASGITALVYEDTTPVFEKVYYYKVSAVNDVGTGPTSNADAGNSETVLSPAAPGDVTASQGVYVTSILVAWDQAERASKYNIYRCSTSDGVYIKIYTSSINEFSYTDTTATAGIHWFYKVTAENNAGESAMGSTAAEGWAMPLADQVTGVSASDGISTTGITVTWSAISDALHYHVYRSGTSDGTYNIIADDLASATYTDSSVDATHHWYYKISAVNPAGEGLQSVSDDGWVIVKAPTGISLNNRSFSSDIDISWTSSTGATGYNIYRSRDQYGEYTMITSSPVSGTSYRDEDVTATLLGTTWWYKLKAVNGDGESAFSSICSVKNYPYPW